MIYPNKDLPCPYDHHSAANGRRDSFSLEHAIGGARGNADVDIGDLSLILVEQRIDDGLLDLDVTGITEGDRDAVLEVERGLDGGLRGDAHDTRAQIVANGVEDVEGVVDATVRADAAGNRRRHGGPRQGSPQPGR